MNILVPHEWLQDHLETHATPEEIQRILSLCGPSVERIEDVDGDRVYDIEVTTNRMDTASVRGIAREASVILPHAEKDAVLLPLHTYEPKHGDVTHKTENFPVDIQNDPNLCSRVTCVVLNVKIKESPAWLKKRLGQIGIRSLNNVIDVTNYVMAEIGHPTHAFDADRVGKTMIVRASKKGEKLTTLDGKTHTLSGGDIVIDNGVGELIDLVGIMGTANSVVQESTTRVLFFVDHSNPSRIRKTSMGLAIRTNAAQLNEKMVDPNLAMNALLRGVALFQEVASATVESPILDLYPSPIEPTTIVLPEKLVKTYLGLELPIKTQQDILEKLGCVVKRKDDAFSVTIPTLRPDLEIPVDLVEEIARIYGYHNLPSQLMDTRLPISYPEDTDFSLEHTVKQFLADLGWQEVYTYSAVSAALAEKSGKSLESHLKLLNPLNDDHVYMRQSLVPSHEEVIENNKHLESVSIFEIANVYTPRENDLPDESLRLTLTSTRPYREVKGHVEALLTKLFVPKKGIEFVQNGNRHAEIQIHGQQIGSIVHGENGHTTVGFLWKSLLRVSQKHPTYVPTSLFSPIIEDMTFTIPDKVKVGDVLKTLTATDSFIQDVVMKDLYHRNATFTIQYASAAKQLSTLDVEPIRKMIVKNLADAFHATFVGKGV